MALLARPGLGSVSEWTAPSGHTMQEETPLAPAQIITSVILLPQDFLHLAVDTRGRATCYSLLGVFGCRESQGPLTHPGHVEGHPGSTLNLNKSSCGHSVCQLPPQAELQQSSADQPCSTHPGHFSPSDAVDRQCEGPFFLPMEEADFL